MKSRPKLLKRNMIIFSCTNSIVATHKVVASCALACPTSDVAPHRHESCFFLNLVIFSRASSVDGLGADAAHAGSRGGSVIDRVILCQFAVCALPEFYF
jgi:hypothetical protein